MHPPTIIFVMLAGLMLVVLSWRLMEWQVENRRIGCIPVAFVLILALTISRIRDLEFLDFPGLVGLNDFDNVPVGPHNKYEH